MKERRRQPPRGVRNRSPSLPGASPPPVITAKLSGRDKDGDLIAEAVEWNVALHGPAPRIAVIASAQRRAEPAPRLGDVVLLRLHRSTREGVSYVGRVLKKIGRASERRVGLVRLDSRGGAQVVAIEKRAAGWSWGIRPDDLHGASDGDLVAFETITPPRASRPMAKVSDILGRLEGAKALSLIAIARHGLPYRFSAEALAEAEAARLSGGPREDWRALPLITIDPADARDHDDAVHASADSDPANPGGFVITVAIADVSAFVPTGSLLDLEARERGNSIYFPDQVVPMLPEHLSNGLCSLRPDEDRAALAIRMIIDAGGRKRGQSLHRILMRSAAKLSYPQAQAAIDGEPTDITAHVLDTLLRPLWAAYGALTQARNKRSPLALDLAERKLLLKPDGSLDRVVVPPRLDAHRLIEEYMIAANVAAAELLEARRQPLIYRVHDQPSLDRLSSLRDFLSTLDIPFAKGGVMKAALFNRTLEKVRGLPVELLVNEAVLRTQAQAEYSTHNLGHFGLNLGRYAHFTSPIRRYADLTVHRALVRAYRLGSDTGQGLPEAELEQIALQTTLAERRATLAERETNDRIIATSLAGQVGAVFSARISGLTRAGLFVTLVDSGADGLVPMAMLGRDDFKVDEKRREISGRRSKTTWRQGDMIEVRLIEAQAIAGALRFEVLPASRQGPRSGASMPSSSETAERRGKSSVIKSGKARRGADGSASGADRHVVDDE